MANKFFNTDNENEYVTEQTNNKKISGIPYDKLVIIITIILVIMAGALIVYFMKDDKIDENDNNIHHVNQNEEKKDEDSSNTIEEQKNIYTLTCKQEDEHFSYINTFTFERDKNEVTEVEINYHILDYTNGNYSEEYNKAKEGASQIDMMNIYLNFDQNPEGVYTQKYLLENDTMDIDIKFKKYEIKNDEIMDFVFTPINDYTLDTINEIMADQSDICKVS